MSGGVFLFLCLLDVYFSFLGVFCPLCFRVQCFFFVFAMCILVFLGVCLSFDFMLDVLWCLWGFVLMLVSLEMYSCFVFVCAYWVCSCFQGVFIYFFKVFIRRVLLCLIEGCIRVFGVYACVFWGVSFFFLVFWLWTRLTGCIFVVGVYE